MQATKKEGIVVVSIKELFKKIAGIFSNKKRLPPAKEEVQTFSDKEITEIKENKLAKELKVINPNDLLCDEIVKRGIDSEMLKGEMKSKLLEAINEQNGKKVIPFTSLYKNQLKDDEIHEWVEGMLEGIDINGKKGTIKITEEEIYNATHRKKEKEFLFDKYSKKGKITIKEATRYAIGVGSKIGYFNGQTEHVGRTAAEKTMHINVNGEIDKIDYLKLNKEGFETIHSSYQQKALFIEEGSYPRDVKEAMTMENGEITYEYPNGEKGKFVVPKNINQYRNIKDTNNTYISIVSLQETSLKEAQETAKEGQEYDG